MQGNELNLTPKNKSPIVSIRESIKNENKNEIIQLFNKVYDRNFLSMINELSISILNYHKTFVKQSNLFKNLFIEKDNKENLIDLLEQIKFNFNQIDSMSSKFYSDAKIIFKKMKIYRNNITKNFKQPEIKYRHKKSVSINLDIENDNKLSSLNDEINSKKISILNNDKPCQNNYLSNTANIRNEKYENNKKEIINLSNYDSNKSSNINPFIYTLNSELQQEKKIYEDSKTMINYLDNLLIDLKSFEVSIIDINSINGKEESDKLSKIKKFYDEKKNNLINFTSKVINSLKENESNIANENKKDDLLNKIILLDEEYKNIQQQFEKYKSDEKIKK